MGLLTTMVIYHDELHLLQDEPEQVCKELYKSLCNNETGDINIIGHCNVGTLFKVKKTRHASVSSVYLQFGNTLTEVSYYSDEIIKLKNTNPELFKEIIKVLENNLKLLKNL